MRKWIAHLLTICLVAVMALSLLPLRAEAAGASFSGSSSLRAGDSVTLTCYVSGSNIVAFQGTLSYDSSTLELRDVSNVAGGDWKLEMNGSLVLMYDNALSGISSSSMFTVTFRVKDSVSSGSSVSASFSGITVTYGVKNSEGAVDYVEDSAGSASWSATIAAPLSGNANLASLSCGNATLSPSFSADTTSYSCTVPYEVTYLDLYYSVADDGAYAWVSGNDLSVGDNTVSVGVEAANGNTKYYNIYVTRQQDPNYKAGTNALLESLSPSSGRLSPGFKPETKNYVVYVPFEVEEFSLSGVAQDSKALSVTEASAKLEPGDNELTVTCTAEDGKTKETYTVHVFRMPAFAGVLPTITDPNSADYSAVDAALAKVPANLSLYTDESVEVLKKAMDAVVRDYGPDKQAEVDAMAKAIEDAIAGLEKKPDPADLPLRERVMTLANETLTIPYLSRLTGPLPLKYLAIAALAILALLIYVIGTLVGRHAGKKKALRAMARDETPREEVPEAAEAPAEVPAPEEAPAIEEAPVERAIPAPPAEEPVAEATEEAPEPAVETPAEAPEGPAPEPAEPVTPDTAEPPAEPPVEDDPLESMSLDELLEDIKNM